MPVSNYLQLDVFARSTGGGNPLGVIVDGNGWSTEQMQSFARWTNLVETTFLLAPVAPSASYRVRIFTPTREIAFAGHPSVGSAHAALESGVAQARGGLLVQECEAGLIEIRSEGMGGNRELFVQAPTAHVLHTGVDSEPRLRGLLGNVALGALPPAFVEGGRRWWLAEFESELELRAWQPDHSAIAELAAASDSLGLCVFARSEAADDDLVVRAFPAGVGIVEDPASGAANGLIAAYIAQADPADPLTRGYRVSQGREMGHDAAIRIDYRDGGVWVGGRTNTIVSGHADWR